MTGFDLCMHLLIIIFCKAGNFSIGTSTPKSPLAIMIASDTLMISLILAMASGFSILATTLAKCFFAFILFWRSLTSLACLTNDRAIQLTGCVRMYSRSSRSFSVKDGCDTTVSGRLTPLLDDKTLPKSTFNLTALIPLVSTTCNTILPSSTSTFSPTLTSLANRS